LQVQTFTLDQAMLYEPIAVGKGTRGISVHFASATGSSFTVQMDATSAAQLAALVTAGLAVRLPQGRKLSPTVKVRRRQA
jgi:hypothetical protein